MKTQMLIFFFLTIFCGGVICFTEYHIFQYCVCVTFVYKMGTVQIFLLPKSNTLATF